MRRSTGFSQVGAQAEDHVGTRRHWSWGLSVMTVSIIENGAGRWQVDLVGLLVARGYELVKRTRVNLIFQRKVA